MGEREARKHRDLRRYAHVKPAPPWRARCAARHPKGSGTCTLERAHRGPHIAHDLLRRPKAVWHPPPAGSGPDRGADRASDARNARPAPSAAPAPTGHSNPPGDRGRRSPSATPADPSDVLTRTWRRLAHMGDHLEELFLAILFLAFAWFVVEWAIRMAAGG